MSPALSTAIRATGAKIRIMAVAPWVRVRIIRSRSPSAAISAKRLRRIRFKVAVKVPVTNCSKVLA